MSIRTLEGRFQADDLRIALVLGRFNELITSKLMEGALDGLRRHGVKDANITAVWVPGAFEIPLATQAAAKTGNYDAVICLGAVIRGETPHFDYVCAEVSKGIAHVSMETGIPVMFGVLTTDTPEQAMERAGLKGGNKGFECAMGAIEMVNLLKQF